MTQDKHEYEKTLAGLKARFNVVLNDVENSSLDFELQNGVLQPEFPAFAKRVSDLVLEYLSVEYNDSYADDVAHQIDIAIPSDISNLAQGRTVASIIWEMIFEVVYYFPYDHAVQDKIVNLLLACTKLPGEELDTSLSDGTFQWKTLRDLPDLNFRLAEIWNGHWPVITWDPEETDTEDVEEAERRHEQWDLWLKMNAFVARLFALNIEQTRQHATKVIWTFRNTVLEQNRQSPKQIQREVTMCSVWIRYAGLQLRSACTEGTLSDAEARSLRNGPLYIGRPGLCQERWEFWQRRLLEITKSSVDINSDTRQLALQTAAQMRESQATVVSLQRRK